MAYVALMIMALAFACVHETPAAQADPNALTEEEKAAGWKLLFDGKTTAGWRGYKQKDIPAGWKVEGGALALAEKKSGDIVTVDPYDSFELVLEFKIASGGNSGIMYRVAETDGPSYHTGPEYQLLDNAGHKDGKNSNTSTGSCYALYAPSKDVCKPAGEWNKMKIVMDGNRVQHWLNGEKIVEFEIGSADWEQKVAASKFKTMPRFGKEPKGHLCLQDHGDRIEFRGIKIRPLPAKK